MLPPFPVPVCLMNGSLISFYRESHLNRLFFFGYRMTDRNDELVKIMHLLFANESLIFCKDTMEEMVHHNWILLWFEAISGLRINLEKSTVMVVGGVENLEDLALELGCKTERLPTTYLGLPLGMLRNSILI